jgi:uncharacterized protein YjeT (DUF2065 family)
MEWSDLFSAFALYLVIEGLLPFISPQGWKQGMLQIAQLTDSQLRKFGLICMLAGLILLAFVRS